MDKVQKFCLVKIGMTQLLADHNETSYSVLNTVTWLTYEKVDRELVASMKCKVCVQFKDKIISL